MLPIGSNTTNKNLILCISKGKFIVLRNTKKLGYTIKWAQISVGKESFCKYLENDICKYLQSVNISIVK